jgi:hypothetical protein
MNAIIFFVLFLFATMFGFCPPEEFSKMDQTQKQTICEIIDADDGGA